MRPGRRRGRGFEGDGGSAVDGMKVVRVVDAERVQPLQVALLCILAVTVGGACLLTSGPHARMEGSRDWHESSPLRAMVHVLNLNYTQTTALGIEIKSTVFGVGAAVAAMACGVGLLLRPVAGEEVSADDTIVLQEGGGSGLAKAARRPISPSSAAQWLMVGYVGWSFLSMVPTWSTAPDMAYGGSVLLATGVVWALVLGRGLSRPTAGVGATLLVVVCALTALLAIAYFGERNPTRRASYPIGNPLFLAACLIPGVLVSMGLVCGSVGSGLRRAGSVAVVVGGVFAAGLMLWAMGLTSSRGGALSLGFGVATMVFLAVGRRRKLPVVMGLVIVSAAGLAYLWPHFTSPSTTGRDASLRLRQYAWWYAIDLIEEAPIHGHGQGGYTQFGDAGAAADVLNDPEALATRIAHAHNEWLEVAADLGIVGLTLLLGGLGLTVYAGMRALPEMTDPYRRWILVALTASLVALMVEESADVALRVAGFPAVFYTVLGLVWAYSNAPSASSSGVIHSGSGVRRLVGVGGLAVGAGLLFASLADFEAARAYQQVSTALQHREFDLAVVLAERGRDRRLSPQRRLQALERLCSTQLYIAREFQTSSLDRYGRAGQSDPADARLTSLADMDRARCEAHIQAAKEAIEALLRRSRSYFGAGWLEYRMNQLLSVYARLDGDDTMVSRTVLAAGVALARELKRSPYDPIVALSYVEVSRERLSLAETFDILARPLRREPIPAQYAEYVVQLAAEEGFDASFGPIWEKIVGMQPENLSEDPLAPEKLRLAALIRLTREDYARALDTVELANGLYEVVSPGLSMGAAACLAESAEYRFFSDPGAFVGSIEYARRALERLPNSTPGRELAAGVRSRMVTYYLAGGDESSARALLAELLPGVAESMVELELGRWYANLCRELIHRSRAGLPEGFERWVSRASALRPHDESVWRLRAQVDFDSGRFAESVECLRRALSFGADPGAVHLFVQMALRVNAESQEFAELEAELRGVVPGAVGAVTPAADGPESGPTLPGGPLD